MNVFDDEAELDNQARLILLTLLARAGLTLEELRAWWRMRGSESPRFHSS